MRRVEKMINQHKRVSIRKENFLVQGSKRLVIIKLRTLFININFSHKLLSFFKNIIFFQQVTCFFDLNILFYTITCP